ncbi:ABC transporter substrate-binding protein [Fusobacterium sp. PH5-44]|uniref:ABC transporter substrate-binding protein n=1 Tax=unclassified Fusobacterium TaxID=2648384 RepID=UPI003D21F4FD
MKRVLRLLACLVLGILLFSAYGFAKENTLIIAQQTDAKSLDPQKSNDVYSHNLNLNIYDRLFDWTPEMKLENNLAESYSQLDPLTLQVKIKEGVKFHNGDELTSEDVKFSIERGSTAPAVMTYFADIERVDIVDKYTVKIVTKKPYGPLMNALAHTGGSIMNKKYVEETKDEGFFKPIGTGPFKFDSWRSGDKITLKANKEYFRGAPESDTVIYRVIPESVNRAIALETKEVDMVLVIDPVDIDTIKDNKEIVMHQMPSTSMTYMGFNCEKEPFKNQKVREAISYGVNLTDIVDTAFLKAAVPANSVMPAGVMGFNKNLKAPVRDVAKAKALLSEAGYKDGLKIRLWLNENKSREDSAVIMQAQLKEIGVDVTIEKLEWGVYLDKLGRGEHDMFILGWSTSPDPDSAMYALFHSKNKGNAGNRSFYGNDRVDELLDKGRATTDQNTRISLYEEAQEIITREKGVLALVNPYNTVGVQKYIEGFVMNPQSTYLIRGVKVNK